MYIIDKANAIKIMPYSTRGNGLKNNLIIFYIAYTVAEIVYDRLPDRG